MFLANTSANSVQITNKSTPPFLAKTRVTGLFFTAFEKNPETGCQSNLPRYSFRLHHWSSVSFQQRVYPRGPWRKRNQPLSCEGTDTPTRRHHQQPATRPLSCTFSFCHRFEWFLVHWSFCTVIQFSIFLSRSSHSAASYSIWTGKVCHHLAGTEASQGRG